MSDPITHYQDQLKEALLMSPIDLSNAVGVDGNYYPLNVDQAYKAILEATYQLIEGLIGPDIEIKHDWNCTGDPCDYPECEARGDKEVNWYKQGLREALSKLKEQG